jgi:polar amino acid transport system substrate-binding protein
MLRGIRHLTTLRGFGRLAAALLSLALINFPCRAQTADAPAGEPAAQGETELQRRLVIRFLTEGDYPPFNYYDDEGVLTGFNVDLARALCLELAATCDIKVLPWDELFLALKRGEADAVIAGHMVAQGLVDGLEFSDRYFHTPGRFIARIDAPAVEITPDSLDGVRIGVAKGTTHEAFLKAFFRDSRISAFENADLAREALAASKVDYVFDDAISLSFWLGGTLSRRCCEFRGGPYFEPRYFGDGMAIGLPAGDKMFKAAVNAGLKQVRQSGRFEELVERYFPNRIY